MKVADGKDPALQSSAMEANTQIKNAGTQMVLHVVQCAPDSEGSCNSPSGSAVSALQSKFKEMSQRRSKGKETHDVLFEGLSEHLRKKRDKEQTSLSVPAFKTSSSADEVSEVQNVTMSNHLKHNKLEKEGDSSPNLGCALGEVSRTENFTTSGDGGTRLSKPTSSPRYWTPLKGFWRAARPETLVSNIEVDPLPITMKNVSEKEQKLRAEVTVVHNELQGLDKVESTSQRCSDQSLLDELGRDDVSDISSCRGGYKMEMARTEKTPTTKTTSAMLAEGQYQPPLINKGEIFSFFLDRT